jgi:prevent-host-death family protein
MPYPDSRKARASGNYPHGGGGPAERSWPVQDARARLSNLIDAAVAGRPQRISRRGKEIAVIISAADYDRLTAPRESLVQFFRNSPLAEAMAAGEIDLERDRDAIRDLAL